MHIYIYIYMVSYLHYIYIHMYICMYVCVDVVLQIMIPVANNILLTGCYLMTVCAMTQRFVPNWWPHGILNHGTCRCFFGGETTGQPPAKQPKPKGKTKNTMYVKISQEWLVYLLSPPLHQHRMWKSSIVYRYSSRNGSCSFIFHIFYVRNGSFP